MSFEATTTALPWLMSMAIMRGRHWWQQAWRVVLLVASNLLDLFKYWTKHKQSAVFYGDASSNSMIWPWKYRNFEEREKEKSEEERESEWIREGDKKKADCVICMQERKRGDDKSVRIWNPCARRWEADLIPKTRFCFLKPFKKPFWNHFFKKEV